MPNLDTSFVFFTIAVGLIATAVIVSLGLRSSKAPKREEEPPHAPSHAAREGAASTAAPRSRKPKSSPLPPARRKKR